MTKEHAPKSQSDETAMSETAPSEELEALALEIYNVKTNSTLKAFTPEFVAETGLVKEEYLRLAAHVQQIKAQARQHAIREAAETISKQHADDGWHDYYKAADAQSQAAVLALASTLESLKIAQVQPPDEIALLIATNQELRSWIKTNGHMLSCDKFTHGESARCNCGYESVVKAPRR